MLCWDVGSISYSTCSDYSIYQTGSGKTYTMWGPANALLDENLSSDQQGLTPRVFERLFARLNEVSFNFVL